MAGSQAATGVVVGVGNAAEKSACTQQATSCTVAWTLKQPEPGGNPYLVVVQVQGFKILQLACV
jgi:hypothetical protein